MLVEALRSKLRSGGNNVMDIQPIMKMLTLQVFGKMAFNTDLTCFDNLAPSKIARSFDFLINEFGRRMAGPLNPLNFFYGIPTPSNLRHKREKAVLYAFVSDLIEQRRQKKTTDNGILSRLMKIQAQLEQSTDASSSRELFDDVMVCTFST